MPTILVVDDSEIDRRLVGGLLEQSGGLEIDYARNGAEALNKIQLARPDVVVTDLQMPEKDGLELVTAVRLHYGDVPVILMTAHGSESLAVEALDQGASSYVPKEQLGDKLVETVEEVLAISRATRTYERLLGSLDRTEFDFTLDNDVTLFDPLVDLSQQMVEGMGLCDSTGRYRVGIALKEALLNALYRGNLEVTFEQMQDARESLLRGEGDDPVERRRRELPYRDRRIHVAMSITTREARFVIRDEGPGFDTSALPPAGDARQLDTGSGRGLVLIRTFMDETRFNETGNEITMVKRRHGRDG